MSALDCVPTVGSAGFPSKSIPFDELTYHSILVLAENYRLAKPPRIRMCLHCLMSVFNINPPPQVRVQTHLQVGTLLVRHTENLDLAQFHLQTAINLSNSTHKDIAYFEAVSLLADAFCKALKPAQAKPILRAGIAASQHNTYWHARLLLQLACLHYEERDHMSTQQLLDVGAELATNCGSDYLRVLFLLSKGMVLLVEQNLDEVNLVLTMCGQLIDNIKNASLIQVESHKVYFLTLQVAHLLSGGQVKSVKSSLKQLQQSIQEITALPNSQCGLIPSDKSGDIKELREVEELMKQLYSTDGFAWLPRDQMCILVYLVTVTYSLLAGYLDKAQKYTGKALKQIWKLKSTDHSPLLTQLELMFLEHMAQCHLVMCDRKAALQNITQGCRLCSRYPAMNSVTRHTTQMHTLLGMYCVSMNYLDAAEEHLKIAVKKSENNEQLVTNMLNLAMVYMHNYQLNDGRIPQLKQQELMQILSQINPDSVALKSRNLKAASYFVKGMFSFFQASYSDAKRFLRETLKMANAQDLNRLTACALVLLGHIYLSIGNHQESVNMVLPAMQLASKIPDLSVKLWASALLRDLYRSCGDEEHFSEYKKMYEKLASRLLNDRYTSSDASRHKIIKWLKEDLPPLSLCGDGAVSKEENDMESPSPEGSNQQDGSSPAMDASDSTSGDWLSDDRGCLMPKDNFEKFELPTSQATNPILRDTQSGGMSSLSSLKGTSDEIAAASQNTPPQMFRNQEQYYQATSKGHIRTFPPSSSPSVQAPHVTPQLGSHTAAGSVNKKSHGSSNPFTRPMAENRDLTPSNQYMAGVSGRLPASQHAMFSSSSLHKAPNPNATPKPGDNQQLTQPIGSSRDFMGISGAGQEIHSVFSNPAHLNLQQAAMIQQPMAASHVFAQQNASGLQHLYPHGANVIPPQNLGVQHQMQNKLQMAMVQNIQQQAWPNNQNRAYGNPSNSNYSWQ